MNVLNTLYVLTPGAFIAKDHQNLLVKIGGEAKIRVPAHGLGSVVCFGHVTASPEAMALCLEENIVLSFFSQYGRFLARVDGPRTGSLDLRRSQYRATDDPVRTREISRGIVAGKIANSRQILLRRARDISEPGKKERLAAAADHLDRIGFSLANADSVDAIRGYEGDAAARYFGAFEDHLSAEGFGFAGRNRNPPRDPVNALLSFAYAMVLNDCIAALHGVGLDPDAGFLHADRPGRPSLALDLMEELRAALADRLVIALINRGQIEPSDFDTEPAGAVNLTDSSRKEFLASYQTRKQEEIEHPFLGKTVSWGMIPHLQARLMARHLRGDLEVYPPFTIR